MKKLIWFSALLVIILVVCCGAAIAASSGNYGSLSWSLNDSGTLTISGSGTMKDNDGTFYSNGSALIPWFPNRTSIKNIVIGSNVRSVGNYAFFGCSNLQSVSMTGSMIRIGRSAFEQCTSLSSISIPNGVSSIGDYAFYGCTGLSDITVNGVKTIGDNAFYNCTSLSIFVFPNTIETIGDYAFRGCTNLTEISFPTSITRIGSYAFRNCSGLTSVTIPNTSLNDISSIGPCAFKGCTGLKSENGFVIIKDIVFDYIGDVDVIVPNGVKMISDYAFSGKSALKSIFVPGSVESIGSYSFKGCSKIEDITLSEGILSIGTSAFRECTSISSISLPSTLISVGPYSFYGCTRLSNIEIPNGFANIEDNLFQNCTSLAEISVPQSVTSIGRMAFSSCTNLSSIIIPNSVTSIGEKAFEGCTSLTSVVIPDSVTSIGENVFSGCTNLLADSDGFIIEGSVLAEYTGNGGNINIPDGVKVIDSNAFKNCDSVTGVIFPTSLLRIGESAFEGCTGLTSITIPNGVVTLGQNAFKNCNNITTISIPISVRALSGCFSGCTSLNNFIYGGHNYAISGIKEEGNVNGDNDYNHLSYFIGNSSVLIIYGSGSIMDFGSLGSTTMRTAPRWEGKCTDVVIMQGVTRVGDYSFGSWTWKTNNNPYGLTVDGSSKTITSVSLPDTLTSIGDYAFNGCTLLSSITLSNRLLTLGEHALSGCTGLTSLYIPESVSTIEESAFSGCCNLTSINIPENLNCIEDGVFSGCSGLTSIDIPDGVTSIGANAFSGCSGITAFSIPEGISSINEYTFYGCNSLSSIDIPEGVTSINRYAFANCSNLTSITLPTSLNYLKDYVFSNCSSLPEIYLPDNVRGTTGNTFNYCDAVRYANLDSDAAKSLSYNGYSFRIPGEKYDLQYLVTTNYSSIGYNVYGLELASVDSDVESIIIPEGVTKIQENAFLNADSLLSVTFSDSVESYIDQPFSKNETISEILVNPSSTHFSSNDGILYSADQRTILACPRGKTGDIVIPDIVKNISEKAFYGCASISSVIIPDSVSTIPYMSFYGCEGLQTINLPDHIVTLGNNAFGNCSQLTSITIPDCTETIQNGAFSRCTSLVDVIILSKNSSFGSDVFKDNADDFKLTILPNSTAIAYATQNNIPYILLSSPTDFIYAVNTDQTLKILGYCGSDPIVVIPDEIDGKVVSQIGVNAFANDNIIESIIIPQSVINIGNYAFKNCTSLNSISLPDSAISIGSRVFDGCSSLTNIIIPDTALLISSSAFANCNAIRRADLNTIGALALSQAGYSFVPGDEIFSVTHTYENSTITGIKLTGINDKTITCFEIPSYINIIGRNAFSGCNSLDNVIISQSVTALEDSAFANCSGLTSLVIPQNVTTIGMFAFSGCSGLSSITLSDNIISFSTQTFDNCSAIRYANKNTSTANALGNARYSFVDLDSNLLVQQNGTGIILKGIVDKSIQAFELPSYITTIGKAAFSGCTNLSSINLRTHFPALLVNSFMGCPASVSILLPGGVSLSTESSMFGVCGDHALYSLNGTTLTIYGYGAIWDYEDDEHEHYDRYGDWVYSTYTISTPWYGSNIGTIVISHGITSIGYQAFVKQSVGSVYLPDSLVRIGSSAFSGSTIGSISIPASVGEIGYSAFSSCSYLSNITFEGNAPSIFSNAFASVYARVNYIHNSSWIGKIRNYGGTLIWNKPTGICGDNTSWTLTDDILYIYGTGIVSEASWSEYSDIITGLIVSDDIAGINSNTITNLTHISTVIFDGELPMLADDAFEDITATVYYPHTLIAWNPETCQNYGGSLTWLPYCTHTSTTINDFEVIHYDETQPVDCITDGHHAHWKCSVCGFAFADEALTQRVADEDIIIAAPGHSLVVFEGTPASCTETGLTDGIFCEVCGEVIQEQEEIPLAPHTDSITIPETPATCITVGYTAEHRCSVCGTLLAAVEETPFGDHTDSISVEAVAPTCTTIGYTAEHRCSVCKIVLEEIQEVPMVPHTDHISVEAVEPTCSAVGHTAEHRCEACNELLIAAEEIPKLPHTDSVTIEYLAPTCTLEGHSEEHTCTVCGEVTAESEIIPATGHTYNNPITAWSEDGKTCTFTFECVHEDDTKVVPVQAVASVSVAPACLEMGTTLYTATTEVNEVTYSDTTTRVDILATGHTAAEDPAVAPTDRETGLTVGSHCSVCNTVLVAQETVPALWNYTDDGKTVTVYNGTETDLTIPAGVTALGDTLFKNRTDITSVNVPSAVTAVGTQTFYGATSMTDIWLPANLDNIGMQTFYNTTATLHTSADGTTAKGISLRNKNFTDGDLTFRYKITSVTSDPTAAYLISWQGNDEDLVLPSTIGGAPLTQIQTGAFAGKDQLKTIAIPDSVTTIASDAFNGCSENLVICSSMTATAKTWAANNGFAWAHYPHKLIGTPAKAATCEEEGNAAYWTCEDCGKGFSDAAGETQIIENSWIIPATGHDLTFIPANASTCEETGNSAYWICETCGKHFSDAAGEIPMAENAWIIPATGHVLEATPAKAATCEETGNTAYWTCENCGSFFSDAAGKTEIAQNSWIINAIGHTWNDATYIWSTNKATITAIRTCRNGNHPETETKQTDRVLITAPTETTAGSFKWISGEFDNDAFTAQEQTGGTIPALNTMTVLKLPVFLTTIEKEAFTNIAAEAIIVPNTVTTIEPKAFTNCKNLKYIKIPAGVVVPDDAFEGSPNVVVDQAIR